MPDMVREALAPEGLFRHFTEFTQIPRPSGGEGAIVAYVLKWASEHDFSVVQDAVGNVCVRVPAKPGREKAPTIVIQGHLDMVCERNSDSSYDAETGPLQLQFDGEWLSAEGTTLGADNGVGVCAGMAAAEDPLVMHGPLELLMTIDEEMGMTGAMGLDPELLRGRIMLNLDSEEDGQLFVGCSGGCDTNVEFEFAREDISVEAKVFELAVSGLRGGHSGLDIHRNRMNANRVLARVLVKALREGWVSLVSFEGGSKRNAIPRESRAVIAVKDGALSVLQGWIDEAQTLMSVQHRGSDDGLVIELIESRRDVGSRIRHEDAVSAMSMLVAIPSGVISMSQDIEGLVETSTNLGVVRSTQNTLTTLSCTRSSVREALSATLDQIDAIVSLAGAKSERSGEYPGWKPDLSSPALEVVREVSALLNGKEPEVCAIHAGLECGLIGERVPGMDMVSFGPEIEGAHSPDERLHLGSTQRFWELLVAVLDRLSVEGS